MLRSLLRRRSGAEGRQLESRIVWILGSPRSGSTWLLNLLAADPRVMKMDEPSIGAHLGVPISGLNGMRPLAVPPERARINDFRRDAPDYFFASQYEDVWLPRLRELILARIDAQVRESPGDARSRVVVIKEPHGSLAADLLMAALPRSRMLFLLRDGRDVVDSELDATAWGSWGSSQLDGFETSDADRESFIRDRAHSWLWKTGIVDRAYQAHAPELRRLIRYEDLVREPEPILAELVDWLGLDLSRQQIAETAQKLSFERLPAEKRGSGSFVRAASPGLWRENLSSEEQELLAGIIGLELKKHGYD